jgi:NAD(P)-dependent dehydrogenase (short-subunit alcohol dehydrogenase family)
LIYALPLMLGYACSVTSIKESVWSGISETCDQLTLDAFLVIVGPTSGEFGEAGQSDYSTSKAGLRGLLLSLKNEIVHFAACGRVNMVKPGWTATPMAEDALSDKAGVSRTLLTIPLRKMN